MKNFLTIFIVLLLLNLFLTKKDTPKAKDLNNHYGLNSYNSPYGNSGTDYQEFVRDNLSELIPLKNNHTELKASLEKDIDLSQQLNPYSVKAGSLSNMANNATALISPNMAPPILKIEAQAIYPKVVEYATFLGFNNAVKNVTVLDKQQNRIINDTVIAKEPVYERERKVVYLPTTLQAKIDLTKKEIMRRTKKSTQKVFHGTPTPDSS